MSDLYWLTDEQVDAATRRLLDEYLVVAARTGDQQAFPISFAVGTAGCSPTHGG